MLKVIIILIGISAIKAKYQNFYRRDYTYLEEYDAYYKLHWDINGLSWDSAFLACEDEDSQLFYPKAREEWIVPKQLSELLKVQPNVTDIFIGIHNAFGLQEFITVDGYPTPSPLLEDGQTAAGNRQCILLNIETGTYKLDSCYQNTAVPFICKKIVDEIGCPTVDKGYVYEREVKKCYKANKREKTWLEAMQTCVMEGGTLAVAENIQEVTKIYELLPDPNKEYFLGIKRFTPIDAFYTVKGKKIELDRYLNLMRNENEDYDNNNNYKNAHVEVKDCVVIRRARSIAAKNCETRLPFICEIEV